jgi:hypothetical protein
MIWFKHERNPFRREDPPMIRLDCYDPCEIDSPGYMFVRIGAAVAIVLGLILASDHLFKLMH